MPKTKKKPFKVTIFKNKKTITRSFSSKESQNEFLFKLQKKSPFAETSKGRSVSVFPFKKKK